MKQFLLVLVIFSLLGLNYAVKDLPLWPRPSQLITGQTNFTVDPCDIQYTINSKDQKPIPSHLLQLVSYYQVLIFRDLQSSSALQSCPSQINLGSNPSSATIINERRRNLNENTRSMPNASPINFTITVTNTSLVPSKTLSDEQYSLNIQSSTKWVITANTYFGAVRAMETFSQLFSYNANTQLYQIKNTPIEIIDLPAYPIRGILIDTARHFLPIQYIKETIDAMMFNKLNVLHWHISDDESFPLDLTQYSIITNTSQYSDNEHYSALDVSDLITYALKKGVRIIPEVDSPGHSGSWLRNNQTQDIGVKCNSTYIGQLDPTISETYDVVQSILSDLNNMFPDDIVHFGGDQVEEDCWDQRSSIQTFMILNKIKNYTQLQAYYRTQQKAVWRKINANKKVAYWSCNWCADIPYQPDDIIHWWGNDDLTQIKDYKNDIILSFTNYQYLDMGFGTKLGGHYNSMVTWADVYKVNPNPAGINGNVLGGIACLWSELNTPSTHHRKLWPRASALAERLWNPRANTTSADLVFRLAGQNTRLNKRGIPTSPITVEFCEITPEYCFAN